jgi:hypothetical protein
VGELAQSVAIMLVAVGQPGRPTELGHTFASGQFALGADGIFGVGEYAVQVLAECDRVGQQPATVGVQRDPGRWEPVGEHPHGGDFVFAGEHAALEFEVGEAVPGLGGLGQGDDRFRGVGRLTTQPFPVVAGLASAR